MPEHFRALAVILFLSTIVFIFANRPACTIIPKEDYRRRRNLWLAITLTAFLAHNFWIFLIIAFGLLLLKRPYEINPAALFFFLAFAVPNYEVQVPGFGLVNYLLHLSYQRILILTVFFPVFVSLIGQKEVLPFGRTLSDKLLALYMILVVTVVFRESSFTDVMRKATYQFIDVFLPYYVISRSLKEMQGFRDAMLCFVLAVFVLALIGVFETGRHWILYSGLEDALKVRSGQSGYQIRAGLTRASASVGTIPLGYLIAIALGFLLYIHRNIVSQFSRGAGFTLLIAGLLATVSRGPWVGAVFIYLVFISTGRNQIREIFKFGTFGIIALGFLAVLPGTNKLIDVLPYFSETEQSTVSYRERLLENSIIVINRHPFFGSLDYLNAPEMESMVQGQGIIDIVNTYLEIALSSGYIGLILFLGTFLTICWGIYNSFRHLPDKNSEECLLGRSLLATIMGILIIIFTVSSISVIPIVYWSCAGLGVAYINMMKRSQAV